MGVVVSSIVFQRKDLGGNIRTEGFFLLEFRNAGYVPGGESFDLSNFMQRVEYVVGANPISGAFNYRPQANMGDYPVQAGSGRLMLFGPNLSGIGVSIASGTQLFISGQLLSGNVSGQVFAPLFSGRIAAGGLSGGASPDIFAELLSGVAVSGVRAVAHVIGA